MNRQKAKPVSVLTENMLDKASWLLSHAQALADYGRDDEAAVQRARAAECAEQVACLLERSGDEIEAAIHRISAASSFEQIGQFTRAVTLLRAALSAPLHAKHRSNVERLLARCLAGAQKELAALDKRRKRKQTAAVT